MTRQLRFECICRTVLTSHRKLVKHRATCSQWLAFQAAAETERAGVR